MNRMEFMAILEANLSALPPEERGELLEDYEAHFSIGLENGKTELEIAQELGDPVELAKEALGNRYVPKEHVYWFGPEASGRENAKSAGETAGVHRASQTFAGGLNADGSTGNFSPVRTGRGVFATWTVYTGLFFLNAIVAPLILSLWAIGISLAACALSGLISPLALGLDYLVHGNFYPAKGFAVIALIGIGILLTIASRHAFKGLNRLTSSYLAWNVRVAKGGK
ncbi:hypothetical protein ACFQ3W_23665 [Paenibacillus puldeungensis]|uniref:DUF1700 domain-containing protein n=1 Tax=Paenibacillus puldeungensis TaxID=696536 RepID=A0ABW3S3A3_9BACL